MRCEKHRYLAKIYIDLDWSAKSYIYSRKEALPIITLNVCSTRDDRDLLLAAHFVMDILYSNRSSTIYSIWNYIVAFAYRMMENCNLRKKKKKNKALYILPAPSTTVAVPVVSPNRLRSPLGCTRLWFHGPAGGASAPCHFGRSQSPTGRRPT